MSNYNSLRLFLVAEGEVSPATVETPWDGENSILVAATSAAAALDLAGEYDAGEIEAGNLVWDGDTIACISDRDADTGMYR